MIDHLVNTDYKVVDKREPVGSVTGYLNGDTTSMPVITDGDKPWGVLNERGLMRSSVNHSQHVESYTVGTGTLRPQMTIEDAVRFFANTPVPYAPVTEDGRLIGCITALDLLSEVTDGPSAQHLMEEVPSLRAEQSIGDAFHAFRNVYPSHLPVVGTDGRLTGVMERKTLAQISLNRERSDGKIPAGGEIEHLVDMPVEGFMLDTVPLVEPNATFTDTVAVLRKHGFAVVAHEGRPLGVITAHHAIKNMAKR